MVYICWLVSMLLIVFLICLFVSNVCLDVCEKLIGIMMCFMWCGVVFGMASKFDFKEAC